MNTENNPKDKEIFTAGITEGVKTKTNYGLVGGIYGGLVTSLGIVCWWLTEPLRGILAALLIITIIVYTFLLPRIMRKMPPSEQYKVRMAELGFFEIDGELIPTEKLHPTTAQNPPQLPQAKLKTEGDEAKE